MKHRIIQRGDGYYQVQRKKKLFGEWEIIRLYVDKDNITDMFTIGQRKEFCQARVFPSLDLALATYQRRVESARMAKLKQTYKVIKIKDTRNVKSKTCC